MKESQTKKFNKIVLQTKKVFIFLFATIFIYTQTNFVYANQAPTPPEAPVAPSAPTQETNVPTAPSAPSSPTAPTREDMQNNLSSNDNDPQDQQDSPSITNESTSSSQPDNQLPTSDTQQATLVNSSFQPQNLVGLTATGNVGDTAIQTGNSINTATLNTLANNNLTSNPSSDTNTSTNSSIQNNGSSTSNNTSIDLTNNNNAIAINQAHVGNNLNQETITGQNIATDNVGNTHITSGDANTTGTVITGLNSNIEGVAVSEFNIVEDHKGDIILDFSQNCILGCSPNSITATNVQNGSNSSNANTIASQTDKNTFQTNDGSLETNATLSADSGHNSADRNTGDDTAIESGNAHVVGNVLTFLNNNLAGNVMVGVVNVFGNLVGDILIPEQNFASNNNSCASCESQSIAAINNGNGTNSTNSSDVNSQQESNTFQTNDASIQNNLILEASTGDNNTNKNTTDDAYVSTGFTNINSQTLNIANSNVSDGNYWLVLVNQAGEWIGKIIGAADGAYYAGSEGTEFKVSSSGDITASNSQNGNGSNNTNSLSRSNNNSTFLANNANIVNNLRLFANTGGNTANDNTGGDSIIKTGNARVVANLVNFINNNIVGNGKLIVTIVNIFGSWTGDLLPPGTQKAPDSTSNESDVKSNSSETVNNVQNSKGEETIIRPRQNTNVPTQEVEDQPITYYRIISRRTTQVTQSESAGNARPTNMNLVAYREEQNIPTLVAGLSSEEYLLNSSHDSNSASIRINLAWLVALIPFIAIAVVLKRRITDFHLQK